MQIKEAKTGIVKLIPRNFLYPGDHISISKISKILTKNIFIKIQFQKT